MSGLPKLPGDNCFTHNELDSGGFKKSPKSLQRLKEEQRESDVKHLAAKEVFKHIAAPSEEQDIAMLSESTKRREETQAIVKSDWSNLGDVTGTRPPVCKYSWSRYSLDEWRKHNDAALNSDITTESNINDFNAKTAIMAAFHNTDTIQLSSKIRLKQKAKEIFRWKVEVEIACRAMAKEVELLEIERQRIKSAFRVLMLPESISKECIKLRATRAELVADRPEQELHKEIELVDETRRKLNALHQQIEEQLAVDKAAKHRIEYDWCDKTSAYSTETENLGLSTHSNTILFKHGAAKYGDFTGPEQYYEFYCRESIQDVETVRQTSVDLRNSLHDILINNGRKIRQQADRTDKELASTVAMTTELVTKLEDLLKNTLKSLADSETLIQNLQESVVKMDKGMKLTQTRLENRNSGRMHCENVSDKAHVGLLQEVKQIHGTVTSLLMEMKKAEKAREVLIQKRSELEKVIASKRNCLVIDRVRCGMIRTHYPTASELAGL